MRISPTAEYFRYYDNSNQTSTFNEIQKFSEDEQKEPSYVTTTWDNEKTIELIIEVPKPVYREIIDGEEQLVYNSSQMEIGKLYEVEFKNEFWALRKTNKEVEFFKFQPHESRNKR